MFNIKTVFYVRELKRQRRQRQRKRHLKILTLYFCVCVCVCYFANISTRYHGYFYRNGELPRNQIGRRGVQFKKENENFTVVCSRSLQNFEFGHFTQLLIYQGRKRNVPKFKTHAQSNCFSSLNLLFCGVVVA